ncbi:hypothetical protein CLOM_g16210 [Closterium sp. NIES-68]|nr:hypothetical protein CLOM_g16210 [Closterium sp. NIES-68]
MQHGMAAPPQSGIGGINPGDGRTPAEAKPASGGHGSGSGTGSGRGRGGGSAGSGSRKRKVRWATTPSEMGVRDAATCGDVAFVSLPEPVAAAAAATAAAAGHATQLNNSNLPTSHGYTSAPGLDGNPFNSRTNFAGPAASTSMPNLQDPSQLSPQALPFQLNPQTPSQLTLLPQLSRLQALRQRIAELSSSQAPLQRFHSLPPLQAPDTLIADASVLRTPQQILHQIPQQSQHHIPQQIQHQTSWEQLCSGLLALQACSSQPSTQFPPLQESAQQGTDFPALPALISPGADLPAVTPVYECTDCGKTSGSRQAFGGHITRHRREARLRIARSKDSQKILSNSLLPAHVSRELQHTCGPRLSAETLETTAVDIAGNGGGTSQLTFWSQGPPLLQESTELQPLGFLAPIPLLTSQALLPQSQIPHPDRALPLLPAQQVQCHRGAGVVEPKPPILDSEPPRPVSEPPRPDSGGPRTDSELPRTKLELPRPDSEPSRPVLEPQRSVPSRTNVDPTDLEPSQPDKDQIQADSEPPRADLVVRQSVIGVSQPSVADSKLPRADSEPPSFALETSMAGSQWLSCMKQGGLKDCRNEAMEDRMPPLGGICGFVGVKRLPRRRVEAKSKVHPRPLVTRGQGLADMVRGGAPAPRQLWIDLNEVP